MEKTAKILVLRAVRNCVSAKIIILHNAQFSFEKWCCSPTEFNLFVSLVNQRLYTVILCNTKLTDFADEQHSRRGSRRCAVMN